MTNMISASRPREFNYKVARCGNAGHLRLSGRRWIGKHVRVTIEEGGQPLTGWEKENNKTLEDEYSRDKMLLDMIHYLTGKGLTGQGAIIARTPGGGNSRKTLLEESKDHMIKLSKQMTTSHINWTLNVTRELGECINQFGDILYDEYEFREKKDKTFGA
jgi:hypothetical protein